MRFFFLSIFYCLVCSVFAQSELRKADSLWVIGDTQMSKTLEFEKAANSFNELAKIYNQLGDEVYEVYALMFKANCEQEFDVDGAMQKTLNQIDTLKAYAPDSLNTFYYNELQPSFDYLKGNQQYRLGNYEQAEVYYDRLPVLNTNNYWFGVDLAINNIGTIKQRLFDHEKAKLYFERAIQRVDPSQPIGGVISANLGISLIELNEHKAAKEVLLKSYDHSNFYAFEPKRKVYIIDNLGFISAWEKDSSRMVQYFNNSEALLSELDAKDMANHYYLKAKSFIEFGDYEGALTNFEKAREKALEYFPKHHAKHAQYQLAIGDLWMLQKEYKQALEVYQNGLKTILSNFNPQSIKDNPTSFNSNSRYLLHQLLLGKAEAFNLLKQPTDAIAAYDATFEVFENSIRYYSLTDDATFRLVSNAKTAYENAIEVAVATNNVEKAFSYSQKAHNFLLIQSIELENSKRGAGVPEELLREEANIKKRLSELWSRSQKGEQLDKELYNTSREYDQFLKKVKTEFPIYEILEPSEFITVKQIQRLLTPQKTYLEFFVGKNKVYTFLINKKGIQVHEAPVEENLRDNIINLRSGIYDYWLKSNKTDKLLLEGNKTYIKSASALFQSFIKPVESELTPELVIVPDGLLHYVPFEALITNANVDENAIQANTFMIEDYLISYNYSAPLFYELQKAKKQKTKFNFLGVAPSFSGKEQLSKLNYNTKETEIAATLFSGTQLVDTLASKENFINLARDFNIIHLSTHGKSNDAMGDESYIAFSESSTTDTDEERLYVREIYGLDLDADLVVLSACETGIGELKEGEGIISFSRAFTGAGVNSTITSLWSVNDVQTTKLMELFYKNLKAGMPKDKALRQAKLTFMSTENLISPFFWASFIPSGNMDPVTGSDGFKWMYLLVAAGILGIGLLLLKRFFQ